MSGKHHKHSRSQLVIVDHSHDHILAGCQVNIIAHIDILITISETHYQVINSLSLFPEMGKAALQQVELIHKYFKFEPTQEFKV